MFFPRNLKKSYGDAVDKAISQAVNTAHRWFDDTLALCPDDAQKALREERNTLRHITEYLGESRSLEALDTVTKVIEACPENVVSYAAMSAWDNASIREAMKKQPYKAQSLVERSINACSPADIPALLHKVFSDADIMAAHEKNTSSIHKLLVNSLKRAKEADRPAVLINSINTAYIDAHEQTSLAKQEPAETKWVIDQCLKHCPENERAKLMDQLNNIPLIATAMKSIASPPEEPGTIATIYAGNKG